MKKIHMVSGFFNPEAYALPPGTPAEYNWKEGHQPTRNTVPEYLAMARTLRIEALKDAQKMLELAPNAKLKDDSGDTGRYYTLAELPALIQELEENPNDPRFLKADDSSHRKLLDPSVNQTPSKIRDFIRFMIVTETPGEAALLRRAQIEGRNGISLYGYKDQFRRPCEEGGHRAFKSHLLVSNGEMAMLAECQIGIAALEEAAEVKALRKAERTMLNSSSTPGLIPKLAFAFKEVANRVQAARRLENWVLAADFNCLLDPDIDPQEEIANAEAEFTRGSSASDRVLEHLSVSDNIRSLSERHYH